mmetsp:Transcript_19697/g.57502  ORF Transcript_19697/g.57502 Transcript_19697/m.57502 type:complete len:244 (-) Transcript_19697:1459-2190(-)
MLNASQGIGSPTATSKMLDPMDDDTAMSPRPCRATMTEESRSGTEVPAARMVSPMTTSGTPIVAPKISASSTMPKDRMPTMAIEPTKVKGASHSFSGGRQSGMTQNNSSMGRDRRNTSLARRGFSSLHRSLVWDTTLRHSDSQDSAASSAAAICLVQKREFSYHSLKSSKVMPPSARLSAFSAAMAFSTSSSVTRLPRLLRRSPISCLSILPFLSLSNMSKTARVLVRMRSSDRVYQGTNSEK